jgi:hypothetical protein
MLVLVRCYKWQLLDTASATMKRPARPALTLQLRHRATIGAKLTELRVQLLALVELVHCHCVAGIFIAGDL